MLHTHLEDYADGDRLAPRTYAIRCKDLAGKMDGKSLVTVVVLGGLPPHRPRPISAFEDIDRLLHHQGAAPRVWGGAVVDDGLIPRDSR